MSASAKQLVGLQRGTYGSGGEKLDWSYYDTSQIVAGLTTYRYFQTQLGAGTPAKTLDRTNLTTAGQIPQGQHFTVHAVKMFYTSYGAHGTADVQNLYALLKITTLEIILPGKDSMGTWTLQEMFGPSIQFAMTPTAAGDNIPLHQPRYHGVFPLNTPLVLAALTPFEIRVIHHVAAPAGLADDYLMISLTGKLLRSA